MRINVLAAGSRGDVQPLVALSAGLARAGHDVTVCAGDDFEGLVTAQGLTFAPAGARIDELIASPLGQDWLGHSSQNPFRELSAMRRFVRASTQGYAGALVPLVGSADLWISGVLTVHVVDAMVAVGGGRHVMAALAPVAPSRAGWADMFPLLPLRYSLLNRLGAGNTRRALAWAFAQPGDRVREELGLEPTGMRGFLDAMRRTPSLLAVSPIVVPPPADWTGQVDVTGYWFLDEQPTAAAQFDLGEFIAEGERPAYVGFGSMSSRDARATSELVAAAARAAGVRVVLHAGSAGLTSVDDEWVRVVGSVPHGWLLPQLSGVVHHGGAGTTGAALRAGVPQAVVAHMGDQPYWGRRVWELGVAARPVRRHQLSAEWLTEVLRGFARGECAERAAVLGKEIRAEDGVARAVSALTG